MENNLQSARALYRSIANQIHQIRNDTYEKEESLQIASILLEHQLNLRRNDLLTDKQIRIEESDREAIENAISRLANYEPIQYIVGEADFYGRRYKVDPSVLIPRRETEELVYHILQKYKGKKGLRVLDIGTGSGCIAITLQQELEGAFVHAIDISQAALSTAKENALINNATIHWDHLDILKDKPSGETYDVIVSNPPYVLRNEIHKMNRNVIDNEPHTALFVDDSKPMTFYDRIINLCAEGNLLNYEGVVFFEINQLYGDNVVELLERQHFSDISLQKDMQKSDRFVSAKRVN